MPRSPNSALISAYMAERGLASRRTAQHRVANNHPDYLDWLAKTGIKAHSKKVMAPAEAMAVVERIDPGGVFARVYGATGDDQPEPPAMKKTPGDRTLEEHAEVETWQMFTASAQATREAAKGNDLSAAAFSRTALECYKAFQSARSARIKADIEARRLLPIAEFEALLADANKIVSMWISMGPRLAQELDPANPGRVLRVFEKFTQTQINPIVQEMLAA